MLSGRFPLALVLLATFALAASSIVMTAKSSRPSNSLTAPTPSSSAAVNRNECQQPCSIDHCLKYQSLNGNCSRLIRDHCDCCTVCLRTENQVCGGHLNVYGLCEQDLLCYKLNHPPEQPGVCVKACLKFQCLPTIINNKTNCECANRRVPCEIGSDQKINGDDKTSHTCEPESVSHQKRTLRMPTTNEDDDDNDLVDCSHVVCHAAPSNSPRCPADSYFLEDHTPLLRVSTYASKNLSAVCCQPRGQCVCSSCPKTICGENAIIQVYRTGNLNLPGQCCDQFTCIKNSKQCYHDKKIYSENATWSIDHCTTCTCRDGLVDCTMVQCPTYTHCGYMYKPENECCPKCGGCLNDRFHVQHMNSTWIESNGCMRCWCENGRSRCIAEGCIAPPCDNPRQIENVCCPVCDDIEEDGSSSHETDILPPSQSHPTTNKCPELDKCLLVCEHGLAKDAQGCFLCACSTMACPSPLCTLKVDRSSKQYCSCSSPSGLDCGELKCSKHCPYSYTLNEKTGCPMCECNACPVLVCTKNCTYGLKRNEVGCSICVCESDGTAKNSSKTTALMTQSGARQCFSGQHSYSNGEIWFDGCRQCLCHRGEQLCALISCPTPKCSQPILVPNQCCPLCPEIPMLPQPIPSSQVCYASQYVTGEELEFDKCTKCICLHNIAFCSISLCPPLHCASPVYDASLCCPVCSPKSTESRPSTELAIIDEEVCVLDDGVVRRAGELWKRDDCQSCLCPRGGDGQVECFSQTCERNLPCSNPVLKKGQCCPFCLPPTAAIAVCIFNYVQYRSGEHWNVSECHRCECSYGTIVCHQHQCPPLTCVHTVTLSGHCCPICRDQLPFIYESGKFPISQSRFGLTIIVAFSVLILVLIIIIIILIFILLRGTRRSLSSASQLPSIHHRSPKNSHHPTGNNSRPPNLFSYVKYDLMSISKGNHNSKPGLSFLSHMPLSSMEQTSTHSIIGTNTTTTTTTGISSSNHELEPGTWMEDDVMLRCSVSTSNDNDEGHEISSSDIDESHREQSSQHPILSGPPTIIYV